MYKLLGPFHIYATETKYSIPGEKENFGLYKDEKSTLEEQDIEKNHKNLGSKSFDTKNYTKNGLAGCILQTELFRNELLSFLKEVRFND